MSVSREVLYAEVWSEPMTTVARRYDVSSNFLARVCERLSIPRPPRGYWAQVKVGKPLRKPALPEPRAGDEVEWARNGVARVHMPAAHADGPRRKPKKPTERQSTHQLLVAVREYFEAARVGREGYLKPYKRNIVDIFVSKETIKRALGVANDLFLALEDRGHHVMFEPPDAKYGRAELSLWDEDKSRSTYYGERWAGPARITVALVKGVAIGLTLFEISAEFEARWDATLKKHVRNGPRKEQRSGEPYDYRVHNDWFPSGRLGLHAYAARQHIKWDRYWRESKPGELAGMLESISKELERAVPTIEKLVAQKERDDEAWRRKCDEEHRAWQIKEAERQRVEREARREKDILETIGHWRMARDVRAYVAEIRALVKAAELEITKDGNADVELAWASAYADRIDPLSSWRADIAQVRSKEAKSPCPKCGKVHATNGDEGDSNEEAGRVAAESEHTEADEDAVHASAEAAPEVE